MRSGIIWNGGRFSAAGEIGRYWSLKTLLEGDFKHSHRLWLSASGVNQTSYNTRTEGTSLRCLVW